ncbi:MAG: MCE family protein [Pseudonocardia sp.]|jgi:phospholipid/cholesterol/gamma-HCH transport system substrate-binding protein
MPYVVDLSGRGPSTATLARRGVVAVAVLTALVAAMLMRYQGSFESVFPATALVDDIGDGVRAGADVKLRGALVGSVGEVRVLPNPGGLPGHEVALRLRPELAEDIPAGVTARIVPTNVFGSPSVELLDPARPTGVTLARNAVIPGDRSSETLQLQSVLDRLDRVLSAVEPARLNSALTNIAQALRGRGGKIASIIGRADAYVTTLNAETETFTADLALLGADLQALAESSPALLDTVDNAVVTTRTFVEQRDQLTAALTAATGVAGEVDAFLDESGDRFVRLADSGRGVVRTVAGNGPEIPRSLESIGVGARKLSVGFDQDAGGLELLFTLTPFAPYTARDCPRYPGASGPNCGDPVPQPGSSPPSFPLPQAPPESPAFGPLSPEGERRQGGKLPRPPRSGPERSPGVPDLLPGMFGGGGR